MIDKPEDYDFVIGLTGSGCLINGGIMPARWNNSVDIDNDPPAFNSVEAYLSWIETLKTHRKALRLEDIAFCIEGAKERETVYNHSPSNAVQISRNISESQYNIVYNIINSIASNNSPSSSRDEKYWVKPDYIFPSWEKRNSRLDGPYAIDNNSFHENINVLPIWDDKITISYMVNLFQSLQKLRWLYDGQLYFIGKAGYTVNTSDDGQHSHGSLSWEHTVQEINNTAIVYIQDLKWEGSYSNHCWKYRRIETGRWTIQTPSDKYVDGATFIVTFQVFNTKITSSGYQDTQYYYHYPITANKDDNGNLYINASDVSPKISRILADNGGEFDIGTNHISRHEIHLINIAPIWHLGGHTDFLHIPWNP